MSFSSDPQQSVRDQAVQWLVARHSGGWKSEDEVRFNEWLSEDAAHQKAFEQVQITWVDLGKAVGGDVSRIAAARRFDGHTLSSRLQQWFIPGISFATIAVLVATLLVVPWWSGSPQTYATARGQHKTITLSDGTQIALNSNSEIVARIGHGRRSVQMNTGEALFTVTHDESRPFTVHTETGDIRDVGTVFNVEKSNGWVKVSVLEGEVKVMADSARDQVVDLGAGQGVTYDAEGNLTPVTAVDATEVLAWREWRHVYRNQPLGEALEQLRSYHDITFEFAEPELAHMPISGSFNVQDIKLFLHTLEATFPVRITVLDPNHIRLQRAG